MDDDTPAAFRSMNETPTAFRSRSRIVGVATFSLAACALAFLGAHPAPKARELLPAKPIVKHLAALSTAWAGAMTANGTCVEMAVADWGQVKFQLTDDATPVTVANFLAYVDSGFYNATIFHRVIESFMIQGGTVNKAFTEKAANAAIVDEAAYGLQNLDTTIAMARYSAADSATDSFYINVEDNVYLDYSASSPKSDGYCAFGRVVDGMDIVRLISKTKTHTYDGWSDVPVDEVVVTSMARAAC